jgi:hypothetical protein
MASSNVCLPKAYPAIVWRSGVGKIRIVRASRCLFFFFKGDCEQHYVQGSGCVYVSVWTGVLDTGCFGTPVFNSGDLRFRDSEYFVITRPKKAD